MIIHHKTSDHPEANGRQPIPGEQAWTMSFPLENGDDYLEVHVGRRGRDGLVEVFSQEIQDDLADAEKWINDQPRVPGWYWFWDTNHVGQEDAILLDLRLPGHFPLLPHLRTATCWYKKANVPASPLER